MEITPPLNRIFLSKNKGQSKNKGLHFNKCLLSYLCLQMSVSKKNLFNYYISPNTCTGGISEDFFFVNSGMFMKRKMIRQTRFKISRTFTGFHSRFVAI